MLVTIPYTQSPISTRLSMLLISPARHCPLNVTSRMVWTTKDIDSFNPTTINTKILLYKFPSSTYSPDWYCEDFCKYIYCIIKIQSQEKKIFNVFNAFNESTPPCRILFKCDKDSIGDFSSNDPDAWIDIQRKCKAYQIIDDKFGGLPDRL